MESRVKIYDDKNGDTELCIEVTKKEFMKYNSAPICDMCGKECDKFYFFPELGLQLLCEKCSKDHKMIVSWYPEDTNVVFNILIRWLITYNLNYSNMELDMIDEFFRSKGHSELKVKELIEKFGGNK